MTSRWDPENLYEVLASESARTILVTAKRGPKSADDLAERCEKSMPVVYRRINVLQEYDLLTERTEVDPEGNHYSTYETALDRVCFDVSPTGMEPRLSVDRDRDLVDRFNDLWTDLEGSE